MMIIFWLYAVAGFLTAIAGEMAWMDRYHTVKGFSLIGWAVACAFFWPVIAPWAFPAAWRFLKNYPQQ